MRATRNRVYGVTRIGGSNPSSSANYQNRREPVFFNCRQSRFVRRLAACPQRTGLRLGHLNSPRSPALSLLIKMFPRACRQKQPERRLFLLSASPHPPITKTGESRFFYCRQSRFARRLAACPQRTGLRLGHLNSPRSPALSLLIKMFPRACRQKQPECRLFLLSASPHPPF